MPLEAGNVITDTVEVASDGGQFGAQTRIRVDTDMVPAAVAAGGADRRCRSAGEATLERGLACLQRIRIGAQTVESLVDMADAAFDSVVFAVGGSEVVVCDIKAAADAAFFGGKGVGVVPSRVKLTGGLCQFAFELGDGVVAGVEAEHGEYGQKKCDCRFHF